MKKNAFIAGTAEGFARAAASRGEKCIAEIHASRWSCSNDLIIAHEVRARYCHAKWAASYARRSLQVGSARVAT